MNYGLYISASGLLTNSARADVYSNNLANSTTTAFKPDSISVRARNTAKQEDNLFHLDSNALLERLGGGVMPTETRVNTDGASLRETGNPLDLAIQGDGFFTVASRQGDGEPRLTRDGRFAMNSLGELVTATDGLRVLSAQGRPIRLDPTAPISVTSTGDIVQRGERVAQIGVVAEPPGLTKEGANLFRASRGAELVPATGRVEQGFVEESGVDAITAMLDVIGANKSVQSNARMIRYFDETMDRAINTLGRVS